MAQVTHILHPSMHPSTPLLVQHISDSRFVQGARGQHMRQQIFSNSKPKVAGRAALTSSTTIHFSARYCRTRGKIGQRRTGDSSPLVRRVKSPNQLSAFCAILCFPRKHRQPLAMSLLLHHRGRPANSHLSDSLSLSLSPFISVSFRWGTRHPHLSSQAWRGHGRRYRWASICNEREDCPRIAREEWVGLLLQPAPCW
jgi:hypothetical protein